MRHALVFGASRGIGAAVCERLAQRGVAVAVVGRKLSDAEVVRSQLPEVCAEHSAWECDIQDAAAVSELLRAVISHCEGATWANSGAPVGTLASLQPPSGPGLDVLVNVAGTCRDSLLARAKTDDIHTMLNTNLVGNACRSRTWRNCYSRRGNAILAQGPCCPPKLCCRT